VREVRSVPRWFAKDGGFTDAMVAEFGAGGAISGGFGIVGRAFPRDGAGFDLRTRANCSRANSIGAKTFSRRGGRACFARRVSERNLQECGGARGRSESSGDQAVTSFKI